MAEFVERRCEEMLQMLNQMERLKLFNNKEVKSVAKRMRGLELVQDSETYQDERGLLNIHPLWNGSDEAGEATSRKVPD